MNAAVPIVAIAFRRPSVAAEATRVRLGSLATVIYDLLSIVIYFGVAIAVRS